MSRRGENIRKRKDGRWEGRYSAKDPQTGRSSVHSVYAKSYGEAKEKLSKARQSVRSISKDYGKGEEICFHKVAEEWLAVVGGEKKHSTYVKYRAVYHNYIQEKVGGFLFSDLDSETLDQIFQREDQKFLSSSLQDSVSCVLNQILAYAVSHHYSTAIKYSRPKRRKDPRLAEVLNLSEQMKLFQYLYEEMDIYKLGIVVCISTGLRLGEICSLKWKDIDFEEKRISINSTVQRIPVEGEKSRTVLFEGEPKSIFSRREIPLSDELARLLFDHHTGSGKYVINKNKPMEPRTYQNKFRKYLQSAGIKKTNFHTLRHTFATNCISGGVDIKSLSEILGHSDVRITLNRYIHPTEEIKRGHMNSLSAIYGQYLGQQ